MQIGFVFDMFCRIVNISCVLCIIIVVSTCPTFYSKLDRLNWKNPGKVHELQIKVVQEHYSNVIAFMVSKDQSGNIDS